MNGQAMSKVRLHILFIGYIAIYQPALGMTHNAAVKSFKNKFSKNYVFEFNISYF